MSRRELVRILLVFSCRAYRHSMNYEMTGQDNSRAKLFGRICILHSAFSLMFVVAAEYSRIRFTWVVYFSVRCSSTVCPVI